MAAIFIEKENGKLETTTPYNKMFLERIKGLKKRFDEIEKKFIFNAEDESTVMQILKEVYGYGEDTITVSYKADDFLDKSRRNVVVGDTQIARRFYRDRQVQIVDSDTEIVSGAFKRSGGSIKKPEIERSDVVLKTAFPVTVFERLSDEIKEKLTVI